MFRVDIENAIIDARGLVEESYPESTGFGSDDFINAFADLKGRDVTIILNSPGGVVSEGLSIFNQIEAHNGSVTVVIDAVAASIASVIAMAAETVIMRRKSQLFIHDPWTVAMGNAAGFRTVADHLDGLAREIADVYAERANSRGKESTMNDWLDLMQAETWFTAEQAIEAGIADQIASPAARESMEDDGETAAATDDLTAIQPVAKLMTTKILAEVLDKRHRLMRERLGIR